MRRDSLLNPGDIPNKHAFVTEMMKAITHLEIQSGYRQNGRVAAASAFAAFLADCSSKVSGLVPVALTARLVTFGDSITYGVAATAAQFQWANIVAGAKGLTLLNQGISGTVLQNRTSANNGAPLANNGTGRHVAALLGSNLSSEYVIAYGMNDQRYTAAPATMNLTNFIADYETVINALIAAGVPSTSITLASPAWIPEAGYSTGTAGFTGGSRAIHESYVAAIYNLAYRKSCKYAAGYERMRDNGSTTLVDPDNIHPNNAGHAVYAQAVLAATTLASGTWSGSASPVPAPAPTPTPSPPPPAPTPPAPAPSPSAATAVTVSSTSASWREVSTEKYDSSTGTTSFDAYALVNGSFTVGTAAWVEMAFSATDAGGVIVLDPSNVVSAFSPSAGRAFLVQLINDGRVFQAVNNAVSAAMTTAFTFPGFNSLTRVRLYCAANGVVTIETTVDDGVTWTPRMTLGSPLTAGTVMYYKLYNTNQRKMYQPRQSGLA